jgi:hypothetical protein
MRRLVVLIASAAINASTIPAVAAACTSGKEVDAFRARWATLRSQPAASAEREKACRAYAESFYESVKLRQMAASCVDGQQSLAALDSDINALNDLLATRCSG